MAWKPKVEPLARGYQGRDGGSADVGGSEDQGGAGEKEELMELKGWRAEVKLEALNSMLELG